MTILLALLSPSESDQLAASPRHLLPEVRTRTAAHCDEVRSILANARVDLLICRCPRTDGQDGNLSNAQSLQPPCAPEDSAPGSQSAAALLSNPPPHLPPILFVQPRTGNPSTDSQSAALPFPPDHDELLERLQHLFPARFSILLIKGPSRTVHQLRLANIDAIRASDGASVVHTAGLRLKDHRTMAIWLRIVPAAGFAKLDRSTIVRLSAIKAVIPHARGASIQFKSDTIPVGRTGCTELRRIMSASPEVS